MACCNAPLFAVDGVAVPVQEGQLGFRPEDEEVELEINDTVVVPALEPEQAPAAPAPAAPEPAAAPLQRSGTVDVKDMSSHEYIVIDDLQSFMPAWFINCLYGLDRADMDTADGTLDKEEMLDVLRVAAASKKAKKENKGEVDYSHFPDKVKKVMAKWDKDGDGTVGAVELEKAAKAEEQIKNANKYLKGALGVLLLILFFLCASMFFLSWASAELAKDTKPNADGIAKVKGTGKPMAMATASTAGKLADIYDAEMYPLSALSSIESVSFKTASGAHVYDVVGVSRLTTDGITTTTILTPTGHSIAVTENSAMLIYPEKNQEAVLERRLDGKKKMPKLEPIYTTHQRGRRLQAGEEAGLTSKSTADDTAKSSASMTETENLSFEDQKAMCEANQMHVCSVGGYNFCSQPGQGCPTCEDACYGDLQCMAMCRYGECRVGCGAEGMYLGMMPGSGYGGYGGYGGYDGYDGYARSLTHDDPDYSGYGDYTTYMVGGYDGYDGYAGYNPMMQTPEMCMQQCDTYHCFDMCAAMDNQYDMDECYQKCNMIMGVPHKCYYGCQSELYCMVDCVYSDCAGECPPMRVLQGDGSGSGSGYDGYDGYMGYGYDGYMGYEEWANWMAYMGYGGYDGYMGDWDYSTWMAYMGYDGYDGYWGYWGHMGYWGYDGYMVHDGHFMGYGGYMGYDGYFMGYGGYMGYEGYDGSMAYNEGEMCMDMCEIGKCEAFCHLEEGGSDSCMRRCHGGGCHYCDTRKSGDFYCCTSYDDRADQDWCFEDFANYMCSSFEGWPYSCGQGTGAVLAELGFELDDTACQYDECVQAAREIIPKYHYCDVVSPEEEDCCYYQTREEQEMCLTYWKWEHYCDYTSPEDDECCYNWDRMEQYSCIAKARSPHYCDSTSPEEDKCCGYQSREEQDECIDNNFNAAAKNCDFLECEARCSADWCMPGTCAMYTELSHTCYEMYVDWSEGDRDGWMIYSVAWCSADMCQWEGGGDECWEPYNKVMEQFSYGSYSWGR